MIQKSTDSSIFVLVGLLWMPLFMVVVCYRAMPVSVFSPENIDAQAYTLK